MLNLDKLKEQKKEILQKLGAAIKEANTEQFSDALEEMCNHIQEVVTAEAQQMISAGDAQVLTGRGVRQLTSDENAYFQKVIDAMRSSNPRQALTDIPEVMPKTVIDAVFEDLIEEHPLLNAIDFVNTSGLVEYLVNVNAVELATWGTLTSEITKELTGGFKKINLTLMKLSAFLPVAKSMLDLGPAYMDRFVRATLGEAVAFGLEEGLVNGTGKDMPIGMNRQVGSGVMVVEGVYPVKTAVAITALDPTTYSTLLATLTSAPNSRKRKVSEVMLIVNPADYVGKVFPATTIRGADGKYINDVFPFPTKVYQSVEVPAGKAIFGLPKRYFMGIGTAKTGKIEFSDEYKFLEDERVYLTKLYGYGEPLDNNAFIYLDISGLTPAVHTVVVGNDLEVSNLGDIVIPTYPGVPDCRLASLTIGSLTLDPAFNKSVFVYDVATVNATNTITAVAKDGEATIEIELNETPHTNGTAATWLAGENTVTVTVSKDGESETYTVVVTKGE